MSDLATEPRALIAEATTYSEDDPDHYVNQWRPFEAINRERKSQWGICTGRADHSLDIVAAEGRLREPDARLISALFNHRDVLIDALEHRYGAAADDDPNVTRPEFVHPHERLASWGSVATVRIQTRRPESLLLIDQDSGYEYRVVDGKWEQIEEDEVRGVTYTGKNIGHVMQWLAARIRFGLAPASQVTFDPKGSVIRIGESLDVWPGQRVTVADRVFQVSGEPQEVDQV